MRGAGRGRGVFYGCHCFAHSLYLIRIVMPKKGLSLKRAVLHVGVVLSLAGLVLCGSSCRTGLWHRSKPADSQGVIPVVSLPQQTAREEVKEKEIQSFEPMAPVAPRPWYKRMWRRGPVKEGALAEAKEDPPVEDVPPELPEEARGMFSASGEPLIKVGYTLKFSVSTGGRLEVTDQIKRVSDKGSISMPLVGVVACEGLTRKELSDRLAGLYEQFLRDPVVSVDFVYEGKPEEVSPWGAVVVYGWVLRPGVVNIPSTRDLTVSRAIQLAGGADKVANQSKIRVSRLQKDGTKKTIFVDLLEVAEGFREKDIKLEPGDVINVPESTW